jgi:hypothetical protein
VQNLNDLIRCDSDDLPENLLGVAIRINNPERNRPHSGIFIRYNSQSYIFHFTGDGQKIYLTPVIDNDWFFFKTLTNIKYFIPSIFAHFRRIRLKSKPEYFFFYGGGLFDSNGNYQDYEGMPNYMTCVGFCLAALKSNMRNTDLLQFKDWPSGIIVGKSNNYVEGFYNKYIAPNYSGVTLEQFSKNVRRITPLEYVTAAFSEFFPAEKSFVDSHKSIVKEKINRIIDDWESKN